MSITNEDLQIEEKYDSKTRFPTWWAYLLAVLIGLAAIAYFGFCPLINKPLVDILSTGPIIERDWTPQSQLLGVPCQKVSFPVQVGTQTLILSGVYYNHPQAKDVILISHANVGSLTNLYRMPQIPYMLLLSHSVFIYDYEGFGVSQGHAQYDALARDGVAAFDYISQYLGFKPEQIILYGVSMGTGVSCEIARLRHAKAIILDSPYTSVEAAAKHVYPFLQIYPTLLCPEPRYDNLSYLRGQHPPVLIFTGLKDTIVPPEQGFQLAREATPKTTFITLPNSTHCYYANDEPLFANSLKVFLEQLD